MLHKLSWKNEEINHARSIRKQFGLVPARQESYENFLARVEVTRTDRWAPEKNIAFAPLITGQPAYNTTEIIRGLTKEYLGIETEPIDAREVEVLPAKGLSLFDLDGSSLLCTQDSGIHLNDITPGLTDVVDYYLRGNLEAQVGEAKHAVFEHLGTPTTIDHVLYAVTLDALRQTEELRMLHEGVHAVDFNNSSIGRRSGSEETRNKPYLKARQQKTYRMGRVMRAISNTAHHIDSEVFAWTVSVDALMQEALTTAGLDQNHKVRARLVDFTTKLTAGHIKQHYLPGIVGNAHKHREDATLHFRMAAEDAANRDFSMSWKHLQDGAEYRAHQAISSTATWYLGAASKAFASIQEVAGSYSRAFVACLGMPLSTVAVDVRRNLHHNYDYPN